ncbi:MAG: trypsin-like peptidase domain-containing protein, partial [Actinobacteria bacterium]|nr:trypsin-like peptidase domain-containing protein [Actinomycetota bacterium]
AGLTAGVMAGTGSTGGAGGAGGRALTTSEISRQVSPTLVDVNTRLGYQHGAAAGTGIVLTSSGEVLTNNHVIEGATSITATDIGNGHTYRAKVVGYDEGDDVAVLQLQGASGLKTATLGDSSALSVGQRVVALGNAGGRGGAPSVATGRVTGLNQAITASDQGAATSERLTGLIQTSAGIQAGDSGGPLLNRSGQVIGMNTAASSGFQFQGQGQGQTQAFAIPTGKAHTIASQITAGQASGGVHLGATAFLGIGLAPQSQGAAGAGGQGAAISEVVPGAPAARAGLVPGDQIVSIGGHRVGSPSDVQSTMTGYHPGNRVSVSWLDQAGQSHSATVTLATGPAG